MEFPDFTVDSDTTSGLKSREGPGDAIFCGGPGLCAVGAFFLATFEAKAILGIGLGAGDGLLVTRFGTATRCADAVDGLAIGARD